MQSEEYERLFVASLPLIERLSRFFCRGSRMTAEDVEDFVAHVRVHLLDDDYAALRRFEGRCTLPTFLALIIQHLLCDYRARHWGALPHLRGRAAAGARRGPARVAVAA